MWFLFLEISLMVGLVYFFWKMNPGIQNWNKQIEEKFLSTVKNFAGNHISILLLATGFNNNGVSRWWKELWNQLGLIFILTFVLFTFTGKPIWLCAPVIFFIFKYYVLSKNVQKRKDKILKRIPFVLDILTLNLRSGLDFVSSLEELIKIHDEHPLHDEIRHTLKTIQIGENRGQAFKNLGNRTQVTELNQLAAVIQQSDTMGSSLIELLQLQSQEIRYRIFKQAEAEAQKAPVKILIPMLLFIFPVVFIILFVPIGIQFFQNF